MSQPPTVQQDQPPQAPDPLENFKGNVTLVYTLGDDVDTELLTDLIEGGATITASNNMLYLSKPVDEIITFLSRHNLCPIGRAIILGKNNQVLQFTMQPPQATLFLDSKSAWSYPINKFTASFANGYYQP